VISVMSVGSAHNSLCYRVCSYKCRCRDTKVQKNVPPDPSPGWTILLLDRASRFIWEIDCGKKDRKLFQKALKSLEKLARQTHDLSLFTDGERRYGNLLFEICHELVKNGKPGRPKKTFKKGLHVRLKNKGEESVNL